MLCFPTVQDSGRTTAIATAPAPIEATATPTLVTSGQETFTATPFVTATECFIVLGTFEHDTYMYGAPDSQATPIGIKPAGTVYGVLRTPSPMP
jgi:hypothetical protein